MIEINNKTKNQINCKSIERIISLFLSDNYIKKDISLAFVGDAAIRKMNKKYRHKDAVTDVLSFEGEEDFFGEVIIDYQQIKRQAKALLHSAEEELVFILVHALYHLLGYDDKTKKGASEMDLLGKHFIKKYHLPFSEKS
jgi:probable rRNA maturation factor